MAAYLPASPDNALTARLAQPHQGLVICYCAAWCDTCQAYQTRFDELSASYPDRIFVWADIEDHPELLGDEDVENFPTLLLTQGERTAFYGTMLPHIGHLQRMLDTLDDNSAAVDTELPDDLYELLTTPSRQQA